MVKILENFCRIVEMVAGLLLGLCTILVVVSAVGRYAFTAPIPDGFDVSRLLIGACIMWGFASVGYRGGHITVDLFVEMMPERVRRWVELMAWMVLLFFVILLTWKMFNRVDSAMRTNEATFDLRLPVWPLMALIWAGTAISMFTITVRLILLAIGKADPEFERLADQKVD